MKDCLVTIWDLACHTLRWERSDPIPAAGGCRLSFTHKWFHLISDLLNDIQEPNHLNQWFQWLLKKCTGNFNRAFSLCHTETGPRCVKSENMVGPQISRFGDGQDWFICRFDLNTSYLFFELYRHICWQMLIFGIFQHTYIYMFRYNLWTSWSTDLKQLASRPKV